MQRHVDDFKAAAAYYATQENADAARLGMTGFCFGGGITWRAATQMPELKGAAPFYGPPPPLEEVPNIRAAVFGVYSDDPDDFANEGREELIAALEEAGVTFEIDDLPGYAAWVPQRHQPALERGAGARGVERHRRLVRDVREERFRRGHADGLRASSQRTVVRLKRRCSSAHAQKGSVRSGFDIPRHVILQIS